MSGHRLDRFFQDVEEHNNWEERIMTLVLKQIELETFQG